MCVIVFYLTVLFVGNSFQGAGGHVLPDIREFSSLQGGRGLQESRAKGDELDDLHNPLFLFGELPKEPKPFLHLASSKRLPFWLQKFLHNPFEVNPLFDAPNLGIPRMFRHQWPWIREDHTSSSSRKPKGDVVGGRLIIRTRMGAPPLLRIITFTTHGGHTPRHHSPPRPGQHDKLSEPDTTPVTDVNDQELPQYRLQPLCPGCEHPTGQDDSGGIDEIETIPLGTPAGDHGYVGDNSQTQGGDLRPDDVESRHGIGHGNTLEIVKNPLTDKTDRLYKTSTYYVKPAITLRRKGVQGHDSHNEIVLPTDMHGRANYSKVVSPTDVDGQASLNGSVLPTNVHRHINLNGVLSPVHGHVSSGSTQHVQASPQQGVIEANDGQPKVLVNATHNSVSSKVSNRGQNLDTIGTTKINSTYGIGDISKVHESQGRDNGSHASLRAELYDFLHNNEGKLNSPSKTQHFGRKQIIPHSSKKRFKNKVNSTKRNIVKHPIKNEDHFLKIEPLKIQFRKSNLLAEQKENRRLQIDDNADQPTVAVNLAPLRRKLLSSASDASEHARRHEREAAIQKTHSENTSKSHEVKEHENSASSASQSVKADNPMDPADGFLVIPVHKYPEGASGSAEDKQKSRDNPTGQSSSGQEHVGPSGAKDAGTHKGTPASDTHKDLGAHKGSPASKTVTGEEHSNNQHVNKGPYGSPYDVTTSNPKAHHKYRSHGLSSGSLKIIITLGLLGLVLAILLCLVSRASNSGNLRRVDSTTALYTPSPRY